MGENNMINSALSVIDVYGSIKKPITPAEITAGKSFGSFVIQNYETLTLQFVGCTSVKAHIEVAINIKDKDGKLLPDDQIAWVNAFILDGTTLKKVTEITTAGSYICNALGFIYARIVFDSLEGNLSIAGTLR